MVRWLDKWLGGWIGEWLIEWFGGACPPKGLADLYWVVWWLEKVVGWFGGWIGWLGGLVVG